jgi:hypothetical protein
MAQPVKPASTSSYDSPPQTSDKQHTQSGIGSGSSSLSSLPSYSDPGRKAAAEDTARIWNDQSHHRSPPVRLSQQDHQAIVEDSLRNNDQ